ncbi:hypothetical protein [Cohnella zeiphila]|uniref:Uncharacterized protein n=1 Tax=Cohnella zeiphila TaxID=2761120 RepID=A0A7X0VU54_9BACL|nr:hypothetical protein [Cohnella zeiphila]MBB6730045.1 hypothetical protein [Cohnella zeiphila]
MRQPNKGKVRPIASKSPRRLIEKAGAHIGFRRHRADAEQAAGDVVYIGPSADGADTEYIKVVSGKVDDRKPSFA